MNHRSREEVLNVALARLLRDRGIISAAERIITLPAGRGRAMPDVLVEYQGLRLVIEGKFDVSPASGRQVQKQAYDRVVLGLAHLGLALLYPPALAEYAEPESILAQSRLRIAIFGEFSEAEYVPWEEGNVDTIADLLRRCYDRLVQGDTVRQAAETIREATEEFSVIFRMSPGALDRAVQALGIRSLNPTDTTGEEEVEEGG